MSDGIRDAGTKAGPIDLGFEAHGVKVTSLHGAGPTVAGADSVHYEAFGLFPKIKDRDGRGVAIFAVLPRTERREEELHLSFEPGFSGHCNPYAVPVEALVCEFDAVYYEGDYPDDALCLVVVAHYPDPAFTTAYVLARPLPGRE